MRFKHQYESLKILSQFVRGEYYPRLSEYQTPVYGPAGIRGPDLRLCCPSTFSSHPSFLSPTKKERNN